MMLAFVLQKEQNALSSFFWLHEAFIFFSASVMKNMYLMQEFATFERWTRHKTTPKRRWQPNLELTEQLSWKCFILLEFYKLLK